MHSTTILPRPSSWRISYSSWTLFHFVEEGTKCEVECTNGGYCNPDNGQCVCPSNCRGVSCENCASTFPYTTILVCFVAFVFVGYSCSWIADLIKRKCRFCLFWLLRVGSTSESQCKTPLLRIWSRLVLPQRVKTPQRAPSWVQVRRLQYLVGIVIICNSSWKNQCVWL